MEVVLTSPTFLARGLHVRSDDAVADGTLALSLESSMYVPPKRHEPVDQAPLREDDDLKCT